MKAQDLFYDKQTEPARTCLLALRKLILDQDPDIKESWKYGMPFFCIRDQMCCYLWVNSKTRHPYLGIVDGNRIDDPDLIQEARARMKILPIDPQIDLPVSKLKRILTLMLALYLP